MSETKIPNGYTTTDGKDIREVWKDNPDVIKTSQLPEPLPDNVTSEQYNHWLEQQR